MMLRELQDNSFDMTIPLPIQVWKLQGRPVLQLALTGGELVSGYAVQIRKRYNGSNGIIVGGYANEVPAYIPTNELLPAYRSSGSYAGGWDTDFPRIAGGSMTVYGWLGHFLAGSGGVEDKLMRNLSSMLIEQ
jgi:neutral ceramidase